MGYLHYGLEGSRFAFDDAFLAHLRLVVTGKFTRGESFLFSWEDNEHSAVTSLWLHPSIPLQFAVSTPALQSVNRRWIDQISARANGLGGLFPLNEPHDPRERAETSAPTSAPAQRTSARTAGQRRTAVPVR